MSECVSWLSVTVTKYLRLLTLKEKMLIVAQGFGGFSS